MMKLLLMTATLAALIVAAAAEDNPNRGNYLRHNYDSRILKKIKWDQFAEGIQESIASITTQPSASSTTYEPSASPSKTPTAAPSKEPTLAPTKQPSDNPTQAPTIDPTLSPVVTTVAPTSAVSSTTGGGGDILSVGTPSAKPTEFNFVFSLGDSVVTKMTLPSFRLEFVATTNMNRKLRPDELMSGDAEQTFIEIVSSQILSYLKGTLARELVSVDLNVEDKSEMHVSQMVMFSYNLGGYVTFAGSEDELPPLPTSNELSTKVLGFLGTDSFEQALKSFDNSGMISIDDVVVSTSNASGASQVQLADSSGTISTSNEKGSDGIDTPAVIAFATAFVFTMAVIGFVTLRKLREYEEKEDDNSNGLVKTTYQNIKEKFISVSPIRKNRQYDQFESPASSEDSLFGDIEKSDVEYPIVTHEDIKQSSSQPLSSTHQPDEAFLAESESNVTSERSQQNLSLDLLYSDTDSYFGSSVGTSNISAGLRPRLLSRDFVYSDTDSSLRSGSELDMMKNNPASIYSVSKVNQLLLYNDDAAPSDSEITEAECAAEEVAVDNSEEENPFASEMAVTGDLFARLNELENKIVFTESQFAQEDAITAKEAGADYKTAYSEAEDSSAIRNNDVGVFTDETLGMIQRDRLRDTPPPSETELEGDVIDCSRSSSLLGNVLDETDGDDDELLFEGSVSTIQSVNDSLC